MNYIEKKELILMCISGTALLISICSLVMTWIQKNNETKRTIRKSLTDTLESITKINIEGVKLKASKDVDPNSETTISLRRSYNSQRRILITHADFLVTKYSKIATEIDFNILADAYLSIGDVSRAEVFWKKTLKNLLLIL